MSGRRPFDARVLAHAVVLCAVALAVGVVVTPSSEAGAGVRAHARAATTPPAYAGAALYVAETPSGRAAAALELAAQQAAARKPAVVPATRTAAGTTARRPAGTAARTTTALAAPAETLRQLTLLRKVSRQPQAQWVGDWVPTAKVRATVEALAAGPRRTGTVLPLVVYNLPHRDCGMHSKGGAASPAAYRTWIDAVAAGLGTTRAIVVLEPDALPGMHCLPAAAQAERLALVRYAGARLEAQPNTEVYLDAGNALWTSAGVMVGRLDAAGVSAVRGFALNVANFDTTANEVRYGRLVSAGLGGKPFVVDTSRNGRGALSGTLAWCNPPGRALGERPTTRPNLPGVDALLWVKTVGASDGACRPGEPPAGTYSPAYALGLAERAAW